MLKLIHKKEVPALLSYLKEDIYNCVYIYADISLYGIENSNMKVWVDNDEDHYNLVIMKYHDSFQIYAREDTWDVKKVINLMREYNVHMVSGKTEMIDALKPFFEENYNASYGIVFRLGGMKDFPSKETPVIATADDIPEIAELLTQDPYYRDSYTREELEKQLFERITTGMGRHAIIRREGKIIAHISTFAEVDDIAVGAGLIAHNDYRGEKLGVILENFFIKHMNSLGFEYLGFIQDDGRIEKFHQMNNYPHTTYGKLVKKS